MVGYYKTSITSEMKMQWHLSETSARCRTPFISRRAQPLAAMLDEDDDDREDERKRSALDEIGSSLLDKRGRQESSRHHKNGGSFRKSIRRACGSIRRVEETRTMRSSRWNDEASTQSEDRCWRGVEMERRATLLATAAASRQTSEEYSKRSLDTIGLSLLDKRRQHFWIRWSMLLMEPTYA